MLSYRHAFHAGNHADVLKHTVLVQLLRYLTQKDKPLWFIDTHAGAAAYALDAAYAQKNAEYESGIGRLWAREDLPQPVAEYVEQVRALNPDGALRRYPGSPQLALQLLRNKDRLRMFELHSTESQLLQQYFEGLANQQGYMKVTSDQPLASFLKCTALESRAHRKTYWPSSPAPFKNSGVRKKLPQNAEFLLETSILNGCPSSKQFVRH